MDKEKVKTLLEENGYETISCSGHYSFDFIAKRHGHLIFVKLISNVENFSEDDARDLGSIARGLKASIMIIGETSRAGKLKPGAVYERFGIPALSLETLEGIFENQHPLVQAKRGGFYVEIDGKKIREEREKLGVSLAEFARRIGVSEKSVRDYEGGKPTTVQKAIKIEEAIGKEVSIPINVFKVEVRQGEQKMPNFDLEVVTKLNVLGFDVAYAKRAPFNVLANEPRENLVSGLHGEHLKKKAELMRKIGDLLEADPVFILKKCRDDSVCGVPIIDEKFLKKIVHLEELLEKVK